MHVSLRALCTLCLGIGLFGTSGCLFLNEEGELVPFGLINSGDSGSGSAANNPTDGATAGRPGTNGINCWDLNGNRRNDPDEDINGDGEFNALDCQGAPGADGADGTAGASGRDGRNGADGADLTGVLARGTAPADAARDPAGEGNLLSIDRLGVGRYAIEISLADFPDDFRPVNAAELVVLITVETQSTTGGLTDLLFASYDVVSVSEEDARIEVQIRQLTNAPQDATFSIVVLGP